MAITKVSPDLLDLDAGITISTADNLAQLTLESTDTDSNIGPILDLKRNPNEAGADADWLGQIHFTGHNDAGTPEDIVYAKITGQIDDASDGSEDATVRWYIMQGGTRRESLSLGPSETVINEASVDKDFRVESDGDANMLFVDGGNDRVGIGTSSPAFRLDVQDTSDPAQIRLKEDGNTNGFIFKNYNGNEAQLVNADNGPMVFKTNDSERMRIQSDGDFFLNTTSAMANCFVSFQDGNNGEAMFGISAKNDSNVGIRLGVGTDRKWVMYRNTSDDLIFYNNASSGERIRLLDAGGIAFNGDTAAANALDDYEEGTWTPTDAAGNVTLQASGGRYTKIGNTVWVWFRAHYPSNSDSNGAVVGGLPFTATNTNASSLDAAGGATTFLSQNTNSAYNGYVVNNTTAIYIFPIGGSTRSTNADLTNKNLYMSAQYVV